MYAKQRHWQQHRREAGALQNEDRQGHSGNSRGRLVVGIGPGNPENMSQRAVQTIKEADVVVGYRLCGVNRGYPLTGTRCDRKWDAK